MLIYALFVVGFIILIKGADLLVEGSSNLAAKMGISEIIIGLTIVSIGTSMPELIVNISLPVLMEVQKWQLVMFLVVISLIYC